MRTKARKAMVWFLIGFCLAVLYADTRTAIAGDATSSVDSSQSGDPARSEVGVLRAAIEVATAFPGQFLRRGLERNMDKSTERRG